MEAQNNNRKVRVRFAPSPTGGLHLGGVRTVLYNYLFAKQHGGEFILRIEDTDQGRFVEGAEQYIFDCLRWCGLEPDESPLHGGAFGPYRQSERKDGYRRIAEELVSKGHAYYAFDTPAELEKMREENRTDTNPTPQYDRHIRLKMRNSLTLSKDETNALIEAGTPHVIRILMPENEIISFTDMIHGEVKFESALVDDKVLLKADGMPTYHLAVVADDHAMQITHAFRGEEWLSSAPVHVLLWKYLYGLDNMPQWAHLPLIMGPNGKLSKRDGAKFGFPVFAMTWTDPRTMETTEGFREKGFLPQAFINLLAVLGWNDGTEQEIYSLDELISHFSMDRVHKAGAKFDYDKATWFNHEWIKKLPAEAYAADVQQLLEKDGITVNDTRKLHEIIDLVKDRATLLPDFITQAGYFFRSPAAWDLDAIQPKWNIAKQEFFQAYVEQINATNPRTAAEFEQQFKSLAEAKSIKPGELQLPLRVMLVGGKFGPGVFLIAEKIGAAETVSRINAVLSQLNS